MHSEIVAQGCSSSIDSYGNYSYGCNNWTGINFDRYVIRINNLNNTNLEENYIDDIRYIEKADNKTQNTGLGNYKI